MRVQPFPLRGGPAPGEKSMTAQPSLMLTCVPVVVPVLQHAGGAILPQSHILSILILALILPGCAAATGLTVPMKFRASLPTTGFLSSRVQLRSRVWSGACFSPGGACTAPTHSALPFAPQDHCARAQRGLCISAAAHAWAMARASVPARGVFPNGSLAWGRI